MRSQAEARAQAAEVMSDEHASAAHALLAVDVVALALRAGVLCVRLVQVREGAFAGRWACPGSLVAADESLEEVAWREVGVERGSAVYLEQLGTFGEIGRDPRGRVVSTAYLVLVGDADSIGDSPRYDDWRWCAVGELPQLAYDHTAMVADAVARLRAKLGYTNIVRALLPRELTLGELQAAYEIVLGRSLDRRNFRKKLLATGLLERLDRKRGGAHRPAQLYRFREEELVAVEIL